MEEGQRRMLEEELRVQASLNPCCNGRGSKTLLAIVMNLKVEVLILVVMEEGQRHRNYA